mmetsp:Transcript_28016/g.70383  ORF Transcript_28016/g.70383 Transcript_28016/m.70383 type:complete len:106 (+) Transcript_28016:293-610(+)
MRRLSGTPVTPCCSPRQPHTHTHTHCWQQVDVEVLCTLRSGVKQYEGAEVQCEGGDAALTPSSWWALGMLPRGPPGLTDTRALPYRSVRPTQLPRAGGRFMARLL